MTVLIDVVLGNHATVFDDLVQITRCDPGLTTFQPTPYVLQVAFQQKQQTVPSSSRLLALSNLPQNILIIGVASTFVFPDGIPITVYGGGGTMPGSLVEPITVYLDVADAGGVGYYVVDSSNQTMPAPRQVILYHELAHAYHMAAGDAPATNQAQQVQAIQDENAFRAQVFLELRNPSNDSGGVGMPSHQGYAFPMCKPVSPGFNWDCIVASAAMGSSHEPRVEELRRVRREYRNLSLWTTLISEPVLDLYRKFSPRVVRDMNTDPALRQAMLLYAVQPMFHLVQITETYLRTDADDDELMPALDCFVEEYLTDLSRSGVSPATLGDAAEGATFTARALTGDRVIDPTHTGRAQMPGNLYAYLATIIASHGGETLGYSWAFEGLALFLDQAEARGMAGHGLTPDFLDSFNAWLGRLPVPAGALNIEDAKKELKVFAEQIFTRPEPRSRFAEHLLAEWPATSAPALRSVLVDQEYLRADNDTTE